MQQTIMFQMSVDDLRQIIREEIQTALTHHANNESKPQKEILGAKEASGMLQMAKSTLYKLTSNRLIPFFKRGKQLYFKRSLLNEWINQGKQKTVDELVNESEQNLNARKSC